MSAERERLVATADAAERDYWRERGLEVHPKSRLRLTSTATRYQWAKAALAAYDAAHSEEAP